MSYLESNWADSLGGGGVPGPLWLLEQNLPEGQTLIITASSGTQAYQVRSFSGAGTLQVYAEPADPGGQYVETLAPGEEHRIIGSINTLRITALLDPVKVSVTIIKKPDTPDPEYTYTNLFLPAFVCSATRSYHSAAIKLDGTLWLWGANSTGELGLGFSDLNPHPVPTQEITAAADWAAVSCSTSTVAIKTDGTLWGWGANYWGELGHDSSGDYVLLPTQEATGATDWVAVSCDQGYTIARKTDGTLWSCGANDYGQLGIGVADNDPHPMLTQEGSGASDWVEVVTGEGHVLARKTDGTIWSWGYNQMGALGIGVADSDPHPLPVQEITGATDWVKVASGAYHSMARKTNGTLWLWGSNFDAELGLGVGDNDPHPTPTQEITLATDWALSFSGGNGHTMVLRTDNTLWGWGRTNGGRNGLGIDDINVSQLTPMREITHKLWQSVFAGFQHTMAVHMDGSMWACGENENGRLGNTNLVDTPYFVVVGN